MGYEHDDLQPRNIMIRLNATDPRVIDDVFLIDFERTNFIGEPTDKHLQNVARFIHENITDPHNVIAFWKRS